MADPVEVDPLDFEPAALPHLGAVAQLARSLTRDRADADDLVQETYLHAFRGWRTFRPGSNVRAWLFAICRNCFLRTRRRRRVVFEESEDGDLDAMPAVMSHVQAVHDGLGSLFDLIDVRPAIQRAVDALPEPHHTAVVLVDLEGYSYAEVAEMLEVPIGTIRSRLFRGRRMVQEALIAYAHDADLARTRPRETAKDPAAR